MISSGTVEKIRSEKGNLRYEYYLPFEETTDNKNDIILLIDSWENQQAIDQHHATSMMKIIAELRDKYDLHMTIERFFSDDNISEQDKGFIRN